MSRRRIGVLSVQGAFAEHSAKLQQLGLDVLELRQRSDVLCSLDGLVLPGGESTAQAKLLRDLGMMEPLKGLIREGLPVLGTCAGLILLAETVESASDGRIYDAPSEDRCRRAGSLPHKGSLSGGKTLAVEGFRTLPVVVRRNGYGRQIGSFTAEAVHRDGSGAPRKARLVFIRAPRIMAVGPETEVIESICGEPVAVRFGNQIGCCFHPELSSDDSLYKALF